jgi:hypothetical protein
MYGLKKIKDQFFSAGDPQDDEREEIIEWIGKRFNPEDIFSTIQLEKWAEANGYIKNMED